MKLFDWFKPKSNAPKDLKPVDVQFTADEQNAMNDSIKSFDAVMEGDAPEGTRMFTPPKVANALSGQGLTYYVEDLERQIKISTSVAETANLVDKAVKAQGKAYALHNLPIYLSRIAIVYESAGNQAKFQEFSKLFQQAKADFEPDQIDRIFLELIETVETLRSEGFDIATLKDQLNREIVAKQLLTSGFLIFSKG